MLKTSGTPVDSRAAFSRVQRFSAYRKLQALLVAQPQMCLINSDRPFHHHPSPPPEATTVASALGWGLWLLLTLCWPCNSFLADLLCM